MRVVFMGTPEFAVPSVRALCASHEVSLVVTRPDAVRGRGRRLEPSPVKAAAIEQGVDVLEASRMSAEDVQAIAALRPDVICVAAFGAILPDELLAIPAHGVVNVHASLLPHGRGAAPIQRGVLEGDPSVGVSIMRIVHELDAGPYCRQASIAVDNKPCAALMGELGELGASELIHALADMEAGTATWVEQDESQVTYAAKIEKSEMLLDPHDPAIVNARRVQASLDAAPARAVVAGRGVRVTLACTGDVPVDEGRAIVRKGHVWLGCADDSIEVLRVKPDGKREMEASAWASGLRSGDLAWGRA